MRRTRHIVFVVLQLLLVAFAASSPTRAQGVIVPRQRCPPNAECVQRTLPRSLPISSIKVDTKIAQQVATTHVEQVFRNDTDVVLEGTYFFPVPETASVSEFAIWDGSRRLVGEVRSREEARRIYDEIVRRQRDPGLLEYAGKDLFQASIFPIPPHSDKKLELTYTQVLRAESGTVSYRYPLGTGHNLVSIGQVSGTVEIEGKEPVRNIYSPSHAVDVSRSKTDERRARVSFESAAGREPQDFQLFYTLSDADFGMSLVTNREPGKDGYFLLTISPKDNWAESEYASKDIVFVLDTSGSMAEEGKMEKARAALLFGIRSLRDGDRFNVISFAGEEHLMEGGLIAANATGRARGVEFVNGLRANGGTNINGAMLAALRQFDHNDRPKMLVFLTDGLPTVGETNPQRIIENARTQRREGMRLFSFGVGYDVNTVLLDKLASENGGTSDYVEPKEDLEVKVSSFFSKVNYPVLTDLAIDWGGVDADLLYPRELPDLFRGAQVTLIGRYRNASDLKNVRLKLSGKTNNQSRSFAYENLRFPSNSDDNDFLPRLWATRRVGWLMEQIRTNGEQKELRDEIVDLGTRYGIVTPYTSYLALESNIDDAMQITNGVRRSRAPRDTVGGIAGGGGNRQVSDLSTMALPTPAPTPIPMIEKEAKNAPASAPKVSGVGAVHESVTVTRMKDADRAESEGRSGAVRNVAGKTFYLREGDVWTDAEFKADSKLTETAVAFGSEAYFDLIKREPKLADYFSLGERIVVVFKGRVYRVTK
ncbi:MAG: Ca-activated chloride channel [Actinomycetota bacterium]|jgi:Ca-activated chloride channel family protein|nr:Ca-activated chloride channel [Actinomycetota bacterium]